MTTAASFRLRWLDAVASAGGPRLPVTRHVLLTLAKHMATDGSRCFPSVALLANETALGERTVRRHLQVAERDGWIVRSEVGSGRGQGWRRYIYRPAIPEGAVTLTARHKEGPASATAPSEVNVRSEGPEGAVRGAANVRSQRPQSPPKESTQGVHPSTTASPAAKATRYPPEFESLWLVYPRREGGNPKPRALKAWRARIKEGVPPEDIEAGLHRYAAYVRERGDEGTRFVMQAATFFGPDERWAEPWRIEPQQNQRPARAAWRPPQSGFTSDYYSDDDVAETAEDKQIAAGGYQ